MLAPSHVDAGVGGDGAGVGRTGCCVGAGVGEDVGDGVGMGVGIAVGCVGGGVGAGAFVGDAVGGCVGAGVGGCVGAGVGGCVGAGAGGCVGASVGGCEGAGVGGLVGAAVGACVGVTGAGVGDGGVEPPSHQTAFPSEHVLHCSLDCAHQLFEGALPPQEPQKSFASLVHQQQNAEDGCGALGAGAITGTPPEHQVAAPLAHVLQLPSDCAHQLEASATALQLPQASLGSLAE